MRGVPRRESGAGAVVDVHAPTAPLGRFRRASPRISYLSLKGTWLKFTEPYGALRQALATKRPHGAPVTPYSVAVVPFRRAICAGNAAESLTLRWSTTGAMTAIPRQKRPTPGNPPHASISPPSEAPPNTPSWLLMVVVFEKWREAARVCSQASVFKAGKPLSYTIISTFRTLPSRRQHAYQTRGKVMTISLATMKSVKGVPG